MIWKTCRLFVASRPATAITTMAVSQPDIQAAAFLGEGSNDIGTGDSRPLAKAAQAAPHAPSAPSRRQRLALLAAAAGTGGRASPPGARKGGPIEASRS